MHSTGYSSAGSNISRIPEQYPGCLATDEFICDVAVLPRETRTKLAKALPLVCEKRHDLPSGLRLKSLGDKTNIWSYRVDRNYRGIVEIFNGTKKLICVKNHDDAYDHATSYRENSKRKPAERINRPEDKIYKIQHKHEIDDLLAGKKRHFMLKVDDDQQELINKPLDTSLIIQGVSGSGKTTVLIYRACRMAREMHNNDEEGTILFVTYNKTLNALVSAHFDDLLPKDFRDRVEVTTMHGWLENNFDLPDILWGANRRQELIMNSIADCRNARRIKMNNIRPALTNKDLPVKLEIDHVILGRGLDTLEQYLSFARNECFPKLNQDEKRFIFDVYQRYIAKLIDEKLTDYSFSPYTVLRDIQAGQTAPKYRHVFVDEVQDVTLVQLKIFRELIESGGTISMAGTATQAVYQYGFNWDDLTRLFDAETVKLKRCYRNSDGILLTAEKVLSAISKEERGGEPFPDGFYQSDIVPVMKKLRGPKTEANFITKEIRSLVDGGKCDYDDISILYPSSYALGNLDEILANASIPHVKDKEAVAKTNGKVKLVTYLSAKGLEFRVVFVMCAGNLYFPPRRIDIGDPEFYRTEYSKQQKTAYVVLTRALERLYVTWHGNLSPCFAGIDHQR